MGKWIIAIAAAALFLGPSSINAQETRVPKVRVEDRDPGRYPFAEKEVVAIREYFQSVPPPPASQPPGKKKKLPPGLKKKVERGGELPPGWQKKVARGEVLDPVVYRQSRPLPPELIQRLPPPPPGTVTITVEGKVVRIVEATRLILDAFDLLTR